MSCKTVGTYFQSVLGRGEGQDLSLVKQYVSLQAN